NWHRLINNPVVIDCLDSSLSNYKSEINCGRFLERFTQTPYIYHFTHLFNAVEIIKSRKIMSRNKAEGKFANAAGNLVDRRSTAHAFARFYYRPQTPTQFYNECLGMDAESGYWKEWRYWDGEWITNRKWQTYYPQACKLGLPKCPMPVFFKFDLEEVISKMQDKCYYSTGNMQTNWANVLKITNEPNGLNTKYVYSTIEDGLEYYKEFSQQEFLVLDEFDFSDLQSFEIICFDGAQAKILKNKLVGDKIVDKITIDDRLDVFHRNNRQIQISDKGDAIAISANYRGDAHFVFKCSDKSIVNTQHTEVLKESDDTISVYPKIEFAKTDLPVEVHFVDERNRDWIVYKN
ncbi:MAG: DUF4433 domain-containing protein, partial [Bacteroidales bacterium]|nr:DUF4433 domain-containing protein [Bacteroidales bacterium]